VNTELLPGLDCALGVVGAYLTHLQDRHHVMCDRRDWDVCTDLTNQIDATREIEQLLKREYRQQAGDPDRSRVKVTFEVTAAELDELSRQWAAERRSVTIETPEDFGR